MTVKTETEITGAKAAKRTVLILGAILFIALGLRCARVCTGNIIDKDAILYITMADNLYEAKTPKQMFRHNTRIPPLYISLMAGGRAIGMSSELTGFIISMLAGCLLPFAVFLIARVVFKDDFLSLSAAFLTAVHPFLIRISTDVMRDSLFVTLTAFAIFFLVRSTERIRWRDLFFAGILLGFSAMTRSEGTEILLYTLAWFCIEAFIRRSQIKQYLKKAVPGALIIIMAYAVITVPVQIYISDTSSTWQAVDKRIYGYIDTFIRITRKKGKD